MNKQKITMIILAVLLVLPLAYAGSYSAGSYNTANYNVGTVPATTPSSGGGSSGGGSSSNPVINSTSECSLDSDCNDTQYCFKNTCNDAECFDDSVCNMDAGETCRDYRCVKLFDIAIKDFKSPVKLGEFFEFTYLIKGMADINDDVKINFWIEKDKKIVTSGHDTIYVKNFEEKTETTKLFLPTDISSGNYVFFVQLDYGTYQANSHRTIEIIINEGLATIGFYSGISRYIIPALIGFFASILLLVFYLERRKVKKTIISELTWIKKYKITLLTSLLFVVLGALIYYLKWYKIIADWSLNAILWSKENILPYLNSYRYYILWGIVLLTALVILIIVARRQRWVEKFKSWDGKRKKEVQVGGVKNKIIDKGEKIKNLKNMKKFFEKYKILLSVILSLIILAGILAYFYYMKILTINQLENLWNNIINYLGKTGEWIKEVGKNVIEWLIIGYNATINWIVGNWLYLTIGAGIIFLGFVLYLVRNQLNQVRKQIKNRVRKHKTKLVIGLEIIILIGVIFYLVYTKIITIEKLQNLWGIFISWIKELIK